MHIYIGRDRRESLKPWIVWSLPYTQHIHLASCYTSQALKLCDFDMKSANNTNEINRMTIISSYTIAIGGFSIVEQYQYDYIRLFI